jgi:isopenicillin N synthase-like dioxygenase
MERVAAETMRVAAAALGLDEAWFDDKLDAHESTMSWMHYPPQPVPPQGNDTRSPAHSDIGSLTFLFQDPGVDGRHPGGLQVQDDAGAWHDVDPVPGQIVMNVGDTMRRWTNDRWRSSKHRVANPPREHADTARISLGFFQKPNFAAMLEPVPGTAGPGNPARYPRIAIGEYMRYRMLHSVGQGDYEDRVRDSKMAIT